MISSVAVLSSVVVIYIAFVKLPKDRTDLLLN